MYICLSISSYVYLYVCETTVLTRDQCGIKSVAELMKYIYQVNTNTVASDIGEE